jgi:hypothetical protein
MGQRPPMGVLWAADTGCFNRPQDHDDDRYLAWLASMPEGCLFATAPDVVGDAEATLARSIPMLARIRAIVPVALVAQDGLMPDMVPWDDIDALFVGGTTAWKLGPDVPPLVTEAKRRGKWAHMGRVNSWKRYDHARAIGCDSVDGTVLRFDPNRPVAEWMARAERETHIWEAVK